MSDENITESKNELSTDSASIAGSTTESNGDSTSDSHVVDLRLASKKYKSHVPTPETSSSSDVYMISEEDDSASEEDDSASEEDDDSISEEDVSVSKKDDRKKRKEYIYTETLITIIGCISITVSFLALMTTVITAIGGGFAIAGEDNRNYTKAECLLLNAITEKCDGGYQGEEYVRATVFVDERNQKVNDTIKTDCLEHKSDVERELSPREVGKTYDCWVTFVTYTNGTIDELDAKWDNDLSYGRIMFIIAGSSFCLFLICFGCFIYACIKAYNMDDNWQ